jgi:hypothetical protein
VCGRSSATFTAYKLRGSACTGINAAAAGTTANNLAQVANRQRKLQEEWAREPPGGHKLQWDGDVRGLVQCSKCTRKWRYETRCRHQFRPPCPGSDEQERAVRANVKKEMRETVSPHALSFDADTDCVTCSKCQGSWMMHNWKVACPKACKPKAANKRKMAAGAHDNAQQPVQKKQKQQPPQQQLQQPKASAKKRERSTEGLAGHIAEAGPLRRRRGRSAPAAAE